MKKAEAIKYFGGKFKLAKALGLTSGSISQWGDEVPELRKYQIEEIMKKESSRSKRKAA